MGYEKQIANTLRIIKAKGKLVQWHSNVDGAPLLGQPRWKPTDGVPIIHDVYIVFFPIGLRSGLQDLLTRLVGAEVKDANPKGNLSGLMGSVNFLPTLKDTIVGYGAGPIRIAAADPLAPDGTPILWELKLIQ